MYSNQTTNNNPNAIVRPKALKKWHRRWWGRLIIIFLTIFLILVIAVGFYIGKTSYLLRTGKITPQQLLGSDAPDNTVGQVGQVGGFETMATINDPSVGPKDAKVIIVAFSDFTCSACRQAFPVIEQLRKDYSDQVRFVYRDMPNTFDRPESLSVAMAGQCAHEQGKFWKMHDKIFSGAELITEADLKTYAIQIGLNSMQFGACLQSGKYIEEIENDLEQGIAAGVEATPTFFINGVRIEGALSLDVFQTIIVAGLNQ